MFRFSIRELLLLTLAIALVAGWCIDRTALVRRVAECAVWQQRAEAIQQMAPYADCQVSWDQQSVSFVFPGGSSQRATSAGGLRPVD